MSEGEEIVIERTEVGIDTGNILGTFLIVGIRIGSGKGIGFLLWVKQSGKKGEN